jgi:transcriptional regulator with XRE-family HTH domain
VGEAVDARLQELAMTQRDLAAASGVSVATIRKIQHGSQTSYSPTTLTRVAAALGWAPDAIDALRHGRQPPAGSVARRQHRVIKLAQQLDRLEDRELRAVERLVTELVDRPRPRVRGSRADG